MANILVVEDESTIREVISAYLVKAGHHVVEAIDGEQASNIINERKLDLIVLDLNLPKKDGIAVCQEIREGNSNNSRIPIIMVTARVEEIDELLGLEIGADDYVKKPFSPGVLVARVEALLRRLGDTKLNIGNLEIDPTRMLVLKDGVELKLTTTQFNILYLLARNPGRVYTREEILERTSDDYMGKDVLWRTVDAHIKSIRKAIEDKPDVPKLIVTMIGKGYKFNG